MTADTITYMDPGAGKDKQNEIKTISKKDFLKGWKGNVTAESNKLSSVIPANAGINTARFLTQAETQKIRGAFFFFLIPAIFAAIANIGAAVFSVLSAIGAIVANIGALVGNILAGIGQILGGVFNAIGYVGNAIWQGISFAASSLFQAIGNVGSFLSQNVFGSLVKTGFGNALFENVVRTGLNFVVTKGLDSLGISPEITRYISAFVSGGVMGGFGSISSFFQNGFISIIPALGHDLGTQLGLDPNLRTAISIFANGFTDGLASIDLGNGISTVIAENLAKAGAFYGISELGDSLGLDSAISAAFALPIMGGIGRSFDVGRVVGEDIIQSVVDGITGSFIQAGMDFAINQMDIDDPLLNALSSAVLTRTVSSLLDPNGNVVEDLLEKAGEFGRIFLGEIRSTDFIRHATERGVTSALETYATSVFSRQAMEEIHGVGGIAQIISGRSQLVDYNGTTLTRVNITSSEGFVLGEHGEFVGTFRTINGVKEEVFGQFDISTGRSKLINGTVRQVHPNGEVSYIEVRGGKAYRLALKMEPAEFSQATVTVVNPDNPESRYITFDLKEGQEYEPVWNWEVVENYDGELTIDGFDVVDGLFFLNGGLSLNISDLFGTELTLGLAGAIPSADDRLDEELYVLTNGILNENAKSEGAPGYLTNLKEDIVEQGEGSIDERDFIAAGTFFTSPIISLLLSKATELAQASGFWGKVFEEVAGEIIVRVFSGTKDVLSWLAEAADPYAASFLADEIKEAMAAYFRKYGNAHRFRDIIALGYSGGFVPTVETLISGSYKAKTLIALGGATIRPEDAAKDLLVKILEAADYLSNPLNVAKELLETALEDVNVSLIGLLGAGLGQNLIEEMLEFIAKKTPEEAYNRYIQRLGELGELIDNAFQGFALDDLTGGDTHLIINMYGTKDILGDLKINGVSLGGYRDNIGGFTVEDRNYSLVNIEIVGASHSDYMRPSGLSHGAGILDALEEAARLANQKWIEAVSAFVADVAAHSGSTETLSIFLNDSRTWTKHNASFREEADRWIIRLPGSELRE